MEDPSFNSYAMDLFAASGAAFLMHAQIIALQALPKNLQEFAKKHIDSPEVHNFKAAPSAQTMKEYWKF